jgi:Cof subfamily protein (haloacid dehalogenase superfamily)
MLDREKLTGVGGMNEFPEDGLVKLIALDIDGTILDSERRVRPAVREAIQSAIQNDLMICLVTGRPRCGTLPILEELDITSPDITSGGAFIYDPEKDNVVAYCPVLPETTRAVVEIARRPDVGIFFGSPYLVLYEVPFEDFHRSSITDQRYIRRTDDLLEESDLQPGKITLVAEPSILHDLEVELSSLSQPIHMTYSGDHFLEINHENVNKGYALRRLSEYMKVPLESVMAVGDSQNDVSMFQVAGISVAMGNATEEVRRHADLLAPTNDEEGIVWVMNLVS